MKTNSQNNPINNQAQGFIASPQVYLNEKNQTLVHRVGDELRMEMPINLYKKILGLPFEKKEITEVQEKSERKPVYGLVARPSIYLSKDGNYLIHRVLGTRISKHINYYKRIFENTQISQESVPA